MCFIPEGLPAAVTLVLTIVAKRMYKQKVMVKSLATVETFNSVSASDSHLIVFCSWRAFVDRSSPRIKLAH